MVCALSEIQTDGEPIPLMQVGESFHASQWGQLKYKGRCPFVAPKTLCIRKAVPFDGG